MVLSCQVHNLNKGVHVVEVEISEEPLSKFPPSATNVAFESTYCLVAACKSDTGSAASVKGPVMVPPEIGNPCAPPPLPDLPNKVLKVDVDGTVNTALDPIARVPTAPVLVLAVITLSTVRVFGVSTN